MLIPGSMQLLVEGLSNLFSTPLYFESNPSQQGCWFPDLRQSPDPIRLVVGRTFSVLLQLGSSGWWNRIVSPLLAGKVIQPGLGQICLVYLMESSCLFWCLYHQMHDFFISRPTNSIRTSTLDLLAVAAPKFTRPVCRSNNSYR